VATSLVAASLVVLGAGCSSVTYSEDFDRQVQVPASGTWAWQPLTAAQERSLAEISPFLQRRIERAVEREFSGRGFTPVSDGTSDYLVSAYAILPDRTSRPSNRSTLSEYDVRVRAPVTVSVGFGVGFGHPYRFGSPYGFGGRGYGFWPVLSYWNPYSWYLGSQWAWSRPYFGYPSYGWRPFFGYGVYSLGGYGRPAVIGSGDRGPGTLVIDVMDTASGGVVWQGLAKGALLDMPSGDELDAYVDQVVRRTVQGFPPEL
jgi:hypothetical protein